MRSLLKSHLIACPPPHFPFVYQAPCDTGAFTPPRLNHNELITIFLMVNKSFKIFNEN